MRGCAGWSWVNLATVRRLVTVCRKREFTTDRAIESISYNADQYWWWCWPVVTSPHKPAISRVRSSWRASWGVSHDCEDETLGCDRGTAHRPGHGRLSGRLFRGRSW